MKRMSRYHPVPLELSGPVLRISPGCVDSTMLVIGRDDGLLRGDLHHRSMATTGEKLRPARGGKVVRNWPPKGGMLLRTDTNDGSAL